MKSISFTIPTHLPGLNEMLEARRRIDVATGVAARGDRYSALKRQWTQICRDLAWVRAKCQPSRAAMVADPPQACDVICDWLLAEGERRDPDNIAAGVKFLLDGLVAAKLLGGDRRRDICSILHRFHWHRPAGQSGVHIYIVGDRGDIEQPAALGDEWAADHEG